MIVVLFEDRRVEQLHPITVGRPAYAVTCGAWRLIDHLLRLELPIRGVVRPHLARIQELDFPDLHRTPIGPAEPMLLVNARLVPSEATLAALRAWAREGEYGLVRNGDLVAAALVPPETPPPPTHVEADKFDDYLQYAQVATMPRRELDLPLLEYPHDVVRWHLEIFEEGLARRLTEGNFREIADGVFAAAGARLGEHVVCHAQDGPILLDENAAVGPMSLLEGPAYLGPKCRVIEHSAIKEAVMLGHTTKIGGEVEASIIEPYTNKQHHGFLGHSYLGSWINLGAGTCNSDLKNTYGDVKMDYAGQKVNSAMQFLGCVVGDYAKTAINTSIFTGKVIGCCSMIYGFVTTNVPSYTNYARSFGQVTELPVEVMVATQRRMFSRRQVEQRPCDVQLLHDMYEMTRHERQLAGEPLSL